MSLPNFLSSFFLSRLKLFIYVMSWNYLYSEGCFLCFDAVLPYTRKFVRQGTCTEMIRHICFIVQDTSHQPVKLLKGAVWITEVLSKHGRGSGAVVKPQQGLSNWSSFVFHCKAYSGCWLQNRTADIHCQHCQAIICLKWQYQSNIKGKKFAQTNQN